MHRRRACRFGFSQGADFGRSGGEQTLWLGGASWEITNDADGISKLCDRLGRSASGWRFAIRPARGAMEAIANYHPVAAALIPSEEEPSRRHDARPLQSSWRVAPRLGTRYRSRSMRELIQLRSVVRHLVTRARQHLQ